MNGIRMSIHLSYGPERKMTVAYAPASTTCYVNQSRTIEQKPMIRICNRFLLESGFNVGNKITVQYGDGIITIRKINEQSHEHNNVSTPYPVTNPTPSASYSATA